MNPEVCVTQDGSLTLYQPSVGECYHSTYGARSESEYIFIDCALKPLGKGIKRVLEVGFGTGLNTLLTWQYAQKEQIPIYYHTLERYPLSETVYQVLIAQWPHREEVLQLEQIHQSSWQKAIQLNPYFTLYKEYGSAEEGGVWSRGEKQFDAIYMDAFSPDKCPELWSQNFLQQLYEVTASGGYLATYCAKGEVRRRLTATGFEVRRTPGPPQGKREILVAYKK